MFGFLSKKGTKTNGKKTGKSNNKKPIASLTSSFEKNISIITELFKDDDTLKIRRIKNIKNQEIQFCIFFCDGVVNSSIINENIVKPLMLSQAIDKSYNLLDTLLNQVIQINEGKKTSSIQEIIESVTYGDTILFANGEKQALILNSKAFQTRSVSEPSGEKVISGPREGFCEAMMINLSLIRRRLRTNELKMKFYSLGERTHTQVCICYIDGIANKKVLDELYRRLDKIDIDGILDSNYITELIKDSQLSPFRTIGNTERPDVVAAKLLEGRIAIFVDGTPLVLTIPYLFIENFQSNEDYYMNFYYSSFARLLRIFSFILTITIPAFFISVVAFHHEMLPSPLLISIATERHNVPLPAALEVFIMLVVFDILRETGVRMPTNAGQSLSIVGALVIGQAAVEASLVAAPVIIVVAFTAITNLLIPKMDASITFFRFLFLFLSSSFGFYGLIIGLSGLFVHLYNLRSFGVPQLSALEYRNFQNIKDICFRAPWWKMINRPSRIATDKVRMNINNEDSK